MSHPPIPPAPQLPPTVQISPSFQTPFPLDAALSIAVTNGGANVILMPGQKPRVIRPDGLAFYVEEFGPVSAEEFYKITLHFGGQYALSDPFQPSAHQLQTSAYSGLVHIGKTVWDESSKSYVERVNLNFALSPVQTQYAPNQQDRPEGYHERAERFMGQDVSGYSNEQLRKNKRTLWITLGGLAAFIALVFLTLGVLNVIAVSKATEPVVQGSQVYPTFAEAIEYCDLANADGVVVGQYSKNLIIDTKGLDDNFGATNDNLACILAALDVPNEVVDEIEAASKTSGSHYSTWNNVEAEWSYTHKIGMQMNLNYTDTRK